MERPDPFFAFSFANYLYAIIKCVYVYAGALQIMSTVNRSIINKVKITEEKSDYSYWLNQPVEARLEALESIREEYNNWKFHDQQGFQRIYRVVKQKSG